VEQYNPRAAGPEQPRQHEWGYKAACSPAQVLAGARIFTEPPAFSTAAMADLDAPATSTAILTLISPAPSRRTPSLARRRTPALTRLSAVTTPLASSSPASIAA